MPPKTGAPIASATDAIPSEPKPARVIPLCRLGFWLCRHHHHGLPHDHRSCIGSFLQRPFRQPGVSHGGDRILVPEQLLDLVQGPAIRDQCAGKKMPTGMYPHSGKQGFRANSVPHSRDRNERLSGLRVREDVLAIAAGSDFLQHIQSTVVEWH